MIEVNVLPFDLPSPERPLSPPIVALDRVEAGYGGRTVLKRLDLTVLPDDRIALLGSNGNGKSTFCKLFAEKLAPLSGKITRANKLEVAYFAQHQHDELSE